MSIVWKKTKVAGETHTVSGDGRFAITPYWAQALRGGNAEGKTRDGYHLRDQFTGSGRHTETVTDAKGWAQQAADVTENAVKAGVTAYFVPADLVRTNSAGVREVYGLTKTGQRIYIGLFAEPIERIRPKRERELHALVQGWARSVGLWELDAHHEGMNGR
jgi:hypothetical protein